MTIAGTIILKLDHTKDETQSGIWLPESMTTENNIGTVLYVGAATKDMTPEVVVGDQVVFAYKSWRLSSFNLHGQDVTRIGFQDVLLINKKK